MIFEGKFHGDLALFLCSTAVSKPYSDCIKNELIRMSLFSYPVVNHGIIKRHKISLVIDQVCIKYHSVKPAL